jgi:hypothetical protein
VSHFETDGDRIRMNLSPQERMFLGDVLPMLAGIGAPGSDPAADRLRVPVYLDDADANKEWWRLMGEDLESGRRSDRAVFEKAINTEGSVTLEIGEANAVLRVLNEARLALGARFGIEVESDHAELAEDSRQVLDYLGWIQEELTVELMRGL